MDVHGEIDCMRERRNLTRTRVEAGAQMILADHSTVDCTVRDLTTFGAGIETANELADCSPRFDLKFSGARSLRHCQLVWQTLNRLGVRFVGPD